MHVEWFKAARVRVRVGVGDSAKDLECFTLDFFFFVRDVRDDVVEDVEGGHARYPAPEMACMVVIITVSMGRKGRSRAKRGTTQAVVEQLAFVMMKPWDSGGVERARCWGRWEELTSGTISGTVGSRRKYLELENTGNSGS